MIALDTGFQKNISNQAIRISGVDFTSLLFRQIDRINESSGYIFQTPLIGRREALITYRKHVFDLEAMMWAKLKNNNSFIEEREKLNIDSFDSWALVATSGDFASLVKYSLIIEKWYKLLMDYMKTFNFYPATDTGFVSGKKEVPLSEIGENDGE